MKSVKLFSCLLILFCCLNSACMPQSLVPPAASAFAGWQAADLRYLQAASADPQHSLIAVYQRNQDLDLQIRLDLLDLVQPIDFDLYLLFDTRPGGTTAMPWLGIQTGFEYDLLVKIPASGIPSALDDRLLPLDRLIPRTANHPGQGMVILTLNRAAIPAGSDHWGLQVFLTLAGNSKILSQTPPVFPAHTPMPSAKLLLVFWDTLPAATPAQTLRRWDGAHTGPLGGRHGLSVLLQAAQTYKVPLVLADIHQPAAAAGLAATGGLAGLKTAAWSREVLLPETTWGDPLAWVESLGQSHSTAQAAGLPAGGSAFGSFTAPLPAAYTTFFAKLPDPTHLVSYQGKRLVPLPEAVNPAEEPPLSQTGLSLTVRQTLLHAALSGDPGRLVVLGSSLPESPWGDLSAAPAAFAYIASHPWISPLRNSDLQTMPSITTNTWPLSPECHDLLCTPAVPEITPVNSTGKPSSAGKTLPIIREELRNALQTLPDNLFSQSAWQSFLALTVPTSNSKLVALQANAVGAVGYLIHASQWSSRLTVRTTCSEDLDYDGLPECVLSTAAWFVVIKPEGGRLVFAAQRGPHGAAQWVGAGSQFTVGLSDPSEWQPQLGPLGDPANIPGAFGPPAGSTSFGQYGAQILQPGQIRLQSPDGAEIRTFSIRGNQLQVEIWANQTQTLRIPITLPMDAQPPAPQVLRDQWLWQPPDGPALRIQVQGSSALTGYSCLDTAPAMIHAEDPNRAYPP